MPRRRNSLSENSSMHGIHRDLECDRLLKRHLIQSLTCSQENSVIDVGTNKVLSMPTLKNSLPSI